MKLKLFRYIYLLDNCIKYLMLSDPPLAPPIYRGAATLPLSQLCSSGEKIFLIGDNNCVSSLINSDVQPASASFLPGLSSLNTSSSLHVFKHTNTLLKTLLHFFHCFIKRSVEIG